MTKKTRGFAFLLLLPIIIGLIMLGITFEAVSYFTDGQIADVSNLGNGNSNNNPIFSSSACKQNSADYGCNTPTIQTGINGVNDPSNGYDGVPLFFQYASQWASISIGGKTVRAIGCATTAVAMVLRYWGAPVDPGIIASNHSFYDGTNLKFADVYSSYGMQYIQRSGSITSLMPDIISSLEAHQPVIIGGSQTGGRTYDDPLSRRQHWVVLAAYIPSTQTILINNPNARSGQPQAYPVSWLENSAGITVKHADFITPKGKS